MASPNPSSSAPPSPAQCVVCGKDATAGCSVCKKAGLDWMYFCSVDHQRLLWKSHKRVCGMNPFEWPALKENEVDEAWELRNLPFSVSYTTTWLEVFLRRVYAASPVNMGPAALAEPDVAFRYFLEAMKTSSSEVRAQRLIRTVRATATSTKLVKSLSTPSIEAAVEEHTRLLCEESLGLLAMYESRLEHNLALPSDWTWSSNFQHRLLILIAVVGIALKRLAEEEEPINLRLAEFPLVQHSLSMVRSMDVTELSGTEPEKAREVLNEMITTILDTGRE
ncbi:zinc finger MYND domain-containing protein [Sporobolomyces salmoneus]|uniref:zinc finger MYND domain-containing protein n=1 Tax=Sporobolomyces salmoneus TaxID=183962 RepID=UPI003179AEBF